jgi:hypothetical protein
MSKKRVFISFRAEDKNKVNGLRLLAANDKFDIEFYDESVRKAIQSYNEAYIKQQIREKINRTSVTVCMVSELTYTSTWVNWELEQSYAKGNTVICMGFKDGPIRLTLPKPCRDRQETWYLWDHEALDRLITKADMLTSVRIAGISGKTYAYDAYDRFGNWLERPANYGFGCLSPGIVGGWRILYFGEAVNVKQRITGHERWLEAVDLGATHVLGHANYGGDVARKAEERDLIALHNPILNVRHRTNHLAGLGGLDAVLSDWWGLGSLGFALAPPTPRIG